MSINTRIDRKETTKYLVCNISNLLIAEKRCHRKVGYKNSVSRFDLNLLTKIYELHCELLNGKYTTSEGQVFEIFEPKYRLVTSTRFKDRIPQSSYVTNYMYPKIISTHIDNNCACVKEKGVEYARNKFKDILRKSFINDYCLKVDFKDYFGSIHHDMLFKELSSYMEDDWCNSYYQDVINCNKKCIGIGLGSEINQLSAVSFLNMLDHKIINFSNQYVRYMDDLLFIGTKEECKKILGLIRNESLRLKLNISLKKTYIQPVNKPIKFLGFTFLLHPTKKVTMKRIKQKLNNEKRKLKRMKRKNVPLERVLEHYQSVRAVMKKGNRSGVMKLDKYVNELFDIKKKNKE